MFLSLTDLAIAFAAGTLMMIWGVVWYSPLLFAEAFRKARGWSKKEFQDRQQTPEMKRIYLLSYLSWIVQAIILTSILNLFPLMKPIGGAYVGAILWLGFSGVTALTEKLFYDKSWQLFLIDAGYQLSGLVAMGAVIGFLG